MILFIIMNAKLVCFVVSGCTSGSVRLHEGKDEYEGTLQICTNGIWESMTYNYWNYFDAEVACRQLWLFQVASTSKCYVAKIIKIYIFVAFLINNAFTLFIMTFLLC